ncbi:hypothetical protein FOQG_18627 [Fusarium oxysporum f. sp. raphani 54005]|uniref:Uncharacterized protein n=4 Tax=Fusarium TaxID=5506 RepID=X0BDS5_FUSOX|nr:uncharacterized protein BKA55DRAFT_544394 [Fusarium redolens]EXA28497.1 hypothetical protein FOVG_19901 [Fusarium oxysporum f. sp. pisi HDV247]EXK76634.1 hypothetical protein FOQG_18627 [Fusarium oxysporum f. sp. raphani 54005]KAG7423649.1 hypothetical protein Forpi1262_v015347 [Fusarium oxysporum f. sp. raphani]KAH7233922.1 hypothetical protein BKA55DRAFT_544394 [Fusarium redolens]
MKPSGSSARSQVPASAYTTINYQAVHLLFEWMTLGRVLTESTTDVQRQFCLCLQLLGLTLLERYDDSIAKALLGLSDTEIVATLSEVDEMEYQKLASLDQDDIDLALHCIALIRILLEAVGGEEAHRQRELCDSSYSAKQNQIIYGAVIGANGPRSIQKVDTKALHDALLESRLCAGRPLAMSTIEDLLEVCCAALEPGWTMIELM